MFQGAIGIVESLGLVGSIEASDAMTKCALVELLGRERIGGGLYAVGIRGDVGSVRAALEAGIDAAKRVGEFKDALFLPRPHDATAALVESGFGYDPTFGWIGQLPTIDELEAHSVTELRAIARRLSKHSGKLQQVIELKGREISHANKSQLIAAIGAALERLNESRAAREDV